MFFFFQAEDGIRDLTVTGVQTCALPISDPLRSQLRTLGAVAGSGGRFVVVPAALIYRRPVARPEGRTIYATPGAVGSAELSIVLVDVRTGQVGWRTVARGEGDDPWTALVRAVKSLTPGLP